MTKITLTIFLLLLLSGCTTSRYSHKHDSAPARPPTLLELQNAEITSEKIGRGNQPYSIKGIRYVPHQERKAYTTKGTASWYGRKFHGHLTSNGEIYNMYAMSAAHKTLPLPSFVKVTNLANNKSTIVRVNDRGPFYEDRIIDLSYAAAYKIGVYNTGTAQVHLEVILSKDLPKRISDTVPNANTNASPTISSASAKSPVNTMVPTMAVQQKSKVLKYYMKLSGIESIEHADEIGKGLSIMHHQQFLSAQSNKEISVLFGPFDNRGDAELFSSQLSDFNYQKNIVIR